jgi:tetratricopeptide (TPR) repeat protein
MKQDPFILLETLETTGQWQQAIQLARNELISGFVFDDEKLHIYGRLFHKLGFLKQAKRAYLCALRLNENRPRTLNNLALLELNLLNPAESEAWLLKALKSEQLSPNDEDLLQATACELRLFQLLPELALNHVEQLLNKRVSVMALSNKAICMHKLCRIEEAVFFQEQAVAHHLNLFAPQYTSFEYEQLVGVACRDLDSSMQLQTMLLNLAIYKLCLDSTDRQALKLLLSGTSNDLIFWQDPHRRNTLWRGNYVDELIVWDDQGFGDTIQGLGWVDLLASQVKLLRLWLRPSLISLVKKRVNLPFNCRVELFDQSISPWHASPYQIGFFFLPVFMCGNYNIRSSYIIKSSTHHTPRIGLVWSAGRHKAPQPERSARVRDVCFDRFFDAALAWKSLYGAELIALQLDGYNNKYLQKLIHKSVIEKPLKSFDWLETAKQIDSLDVLVSVDTSVAHLAAAMGLPTIMLLNSPADWRWGQQGDRTYMYESMYIARCDRPGNWGEAISQANYFMTKIF